MTTPRRNYTTTCEVESSQVPLGAMGGRSMATNEVLVPECIGSNVGFFSISNLKKKKESWDPLEVVDNAIDQMQCKFLTQGGALPS